MTDELMGIAFFISAGQSKVSFQAVKVLAGNGLLLNMLLLINCFGLKIVSLLLGQIVAVT